MKLYLEKNRLRSKETYPTCIPAQESRPQQRQRTRTYFFNFFTVMLHVEKLEEQSKDPRTAFQMGENTLHMVLATKAIHLTGFCCSRGAPRSLGKHSKACWITLQTALSYFCAIKIEFNLNIHPLKVTAILLKVKILLNFSKSFLKRFNLACKSFRAGWYQYIVLLCWRLCSRPNLATRLRGTGTPSL